jgi:hypothetical protein
MSPDRLIYMANQIGKFFHSQGHDKAVPGIAEHIRKFWVGHAGPSEERQISPSRQSYCRRTGRLSGPRKPNPCQRTLAGSGNVMLGKRSNSMGSRMAPTVRRDRCAPAQ